jgi:hypothetical protein
VDAWVVSPFESFGPLRFGATSPEVQSSTGGTPLRFQKGDSPNLTEAYTEIGFHAHYDSTGTLEFVEAFPPCRATYAGVELLMPDAAGTVKALQALGLHVRDDGEGGLWFDQHGFALYAPTGRVEGVSAFRRGYDTGA